MHKDNPFDTEIEEYQKWFKINDKLLDSELQAIRQLLPPDGKGIEIGAGTGVFASKLGIVHGVEPSEKMAAVARNKGIHILEAFAEELPVDDGSYQFALMVTVDCFLDDVLKAFSEIRRILTVNGVFIVAFLDKDTPLGKIYEENKHFHKSYENADFHSAKEIAKLLVESGFEILDKKQTIYSLENKHQEIKDGVGEGVFAVIKAKRI